MFTKYDEYFEGIKLPKTKNIESKFKKYVERKEKRINHVEDLKRNGATSDEIEKATRKYLKPKKVNFNLQNKIRFSNSGLNIFLEGLIYSKYNMVVSVLVSSKEEVSILLISEADSHNLNRSEHAEKLKTKPVNSFEDLIDFLSNTYTQSEFKYLIPLDVFLTNLMDTLVKYEYDDLFEEWVLNIKLKVTKEDIPKGTKCSGCPFFEEETKPILTVNGDVVGERKIYSCYFLEITSDEEYDLLDQRMCGV